jgi:hypothetical protein
MLKIERYISSWPVQCTKVRFASFLSGGFIAAIVVNPPERKLANAPLWNYTVRLFILIYSALCAYSILCDYYISQAEIE